MTVDSSIRRTELKAFLRARRAALLPEACGIQHGRRRLTPGLRREEIAAIANIGVTWYTWLEQGRPINVAAATMRRISTALRLSPTDETYLFSLAALERTEQRSPDIAVSPALSTVLDMYEGPAFVLGAGFRVNGPT
jgi:transcriptional regulator with XRE-family HTH domain